jgi:pimeloyl-ACP methyl ester carboxylesterase
MISLYVVVVPSGGDRTLPPLYDLAGGPGIAATSAADFWATVGSIHRRHRDIVLLDQRGTGHSAPLNCAVKFYDPLSPVLNAAAVRQCRERLSATADLSAYFTAAAVEDLEAVRAALGHEQIDLIGLSYGTRVAQEYLRAHTHRVRAIVLLGTLTPVEKLPLSFSPGAETVLYRCCL